MMHSWQEGRNNDMTSVQGSSEFFTSETIPTIDASPGRKQESLSQQQQQQFSLDILVVDDSHSNRKLLAHLLTRQGHRCTQASDDAVAVELVKQRLDTSSGAGAPASTDEGTSQGVVFDCILLDYEMPNLNGPGAAQQIRDLGCRSLIIGVTRNVLQDDVDHFRKSGANYALSKPINMSMLKDMWQANGVDMGLTDSQDLSRTSSSDRANAA